MRINICYFTSTGNTLWLAKEAKRLWENQGHQVELFEVIKQGKIFTKECDICGFFYPVWESQLPHPFRDLIEAMDEGHGRKFFLIGNCAVMSGDTALVWKKRLKKKGYHVFYADHVYLPFNCSLPFWNSHAFQTKKEKVEKMKRKALKKLTRMCAEIVENRKRVVGRGVQSRILGFLQRLIFEKWNILGIWKKMIFVDKENCTKCGLCVKLCPTGNIILNESNEILFRSAQNCILCLKCYNLCPKDAILIGKQTKNTKRFPRYRGPSSEIKPVLYR